MVVFTCNHCGESLHKPKVEKHYQFQCRNYKSVTCVDCFKDFNNEEYVAHTKCITEDERYAAKGTYKNGIIKKGDVKQESWVEMIKSICDSEKNLRPSLRNLLETISENSNVPRKKAKFMNFIKSSFGIRANMKEVEEVWDIIEQHKTKKSLNNQNKAKNGTAENLNNETIENESNVSNKKRKSEANDQEQGHKKVKKQAPEEAAESNEILKFDYQEHILKILSEKKSMSHKKLQKKILKAYVSATGREDCQEKIIKKFNKKLKKTPNVSIEDDKVTLRS